MNWKKIAKALFFPPFIAILFLVPTATALLVFTLVTLSPQAVLSACSYALAAYTLTILCLRMPRLIRKIHAKKSKNSYFIRWKSDARLRTTVSLFVALICNILYGILQLWLGIYHRTFWFFSLGAYYICLGAMSFFLLSHTRRYVLGENLHKELIKYRVCGRILLILNIALSLIVFFMVYWDKSFTHHMITAIAMAAYTFSAFSIAVANVIKHRQCKSPVLSASKAIGLASALVSMLMLEATMLTAFGGDTMTLHQKRVMLGATGGVISLLIITTAIHMITAGTRRLTILSQEVHNGTEKQKP